MSISIAAPVKTIGDLLHRLGDIPPDRVRFAPAPGTAKRDDPLKPENDGCELVEGTLVEKPVGQEESFLAMSLATLLNSHVISMNLGYLGNRPPPAVRPRLHRARSFHDLTPADALTGDPVLPGFTLPLSDLFAELDRRGGIEQSTEID